MNISRGFLVMGSLYLVVGIGLGGYMGGSGNFTLMPVHAHINLLGFTLMTLFGLAYHLIPALTEGWMAKAHFWLHQIGTFALLLLLYLDLTDQIDEMALGPVVPILIGAVLLGALIWAANLLRTRF